MKLNKDKWELHLPEVTFMGHVSQDELKPDPSKTQGVQENAYTQ